MSEFWDGQRTVIVLSLVCHLALLLHLHREGLGRYFFFRSLLAAEIVQSVCLLPLSPATKIYGDIYFLTSPVIWVFFYLVINELVRLILQDFPAVGGFIRKIFGICVVAAVLIAAAITLPGLHGPAGMRFIELFFVVQRFVILALLVFLTIILLVLVVFRVPLSPNRKRYAIGFALYFGVGVAANLMVFELGLKFAAQLSLWLVTAASAILLAGVVALRKSGEVQVKPVALDAGSRAQQENMQRQLADLNRMLSRAANQGR